VWRFDLKSGGLRWLNKICVNKIYLKIMIFSLNFTFFDF
jgi:hypothetical protein